MTANGAEAANSLKPTTSSTLALFKPLAQMIDVAPFADRAPCDGAKTNANYGAVDCRNRKAPKKRNPDRTGPISSEMQGLVQTVTAITAAVDETALAADSMPNTIATIREDTEGVATEIDALGRGFGEVDDRLSGLKGAADTFSASVAA